MSEIEPTAGREETEQPRKKRVKPTAVSVLETRGQSALIEWADGEGAHRCYVPVEEIEGGKVPLATLEAGIPYGAAWESLVDLPADKARKFAAALRKYGLWRAEDVERKPSAVVSALVETFGISAASLRHAARAAEQPKEA